MIFNIQEHHLQKLTGEEKALLLQLGIKDNVGLVGLSQQLEQWNQSLPLKIKPYMISLNNNFLIVAHMLSMDAKDAKVHSQIGQ